MGSTPPSSVTQGTMHEDVSNRSKAGLTATYAKCNAQSKARCVRPKERAYPIACPIMHSKGPKPERGPDDGQAEIQVRSGQVQHPFGHFPIKVLRACQKVYARTTLHLTSATVHPLLRPRRIYHTTYTEESSSRLSIPSVMVRRGNNEPKGNPETLLAFKPERPSSHNHLHSSACTPVYGIIVAIKGVVRIHQRAVTLYRTPPSLLA
jgi:hypothetical protein